MTEYAQYHARCTALAGRGAGSTCYAAELQDRGAYETALPDKARRLGELKYTVVRVTCTKSNTNQ